MSITHVQGAHNASNAASTTLAITFGAAVGAGNAVAGGFTFDTGATLTSIKDDKNNTYNTETVLQDGVSGQQCTAFSLGNITNAPTVITATISPAVGFLSMVGDEYSGISAVADPRDVHGGQIQDGIAHPLPGTGTDGISSGSFTPANNGDLIFGVTIDTTGATLATAGTGYISRTSSTVASTPPMLSEDKIQSVAVSVAATFTEAANEGAVTYLIALKAAVTAGGVAIARQNFRVDKFKTPSRSMGPNAGLFQVRAYPVVISTGQAPFVQTDWPLPGQNPRLDESFVSDRTRFMVQQPSSFFNHYDWPLPQANPRPDEFYSFENVQFISRQPASLFNHYDWPNPKTYQPIDQFYAYNQTLPMAQQPASFFNHYDWPNPQPVQWYQSWTFSNVQFISQQPASLDRNYDWPNPPRVTWYQDWSQNLQQTTLKPSQNLPFNQYDWPNPRTYPRPDEFYSFSNITVISNQPASFFNNQDWPNPKQFPRPDEFYSFSNVGIISQQPASLYRNYDWPNPRIAPPIDQFWAQNLVANLSNQPMPFNQFDWPNPRGYSPIDQTWYQNLVSFLSQANPQPFNQFDWPLPKTTVPIDQFWSQSLVQTLPPPPPPEQVIGGGHQWTEADVKRAAAQWLAVMRWYPGIRR